MDRIAALPPLRETIAAHGLDARKRFGQHFLLDLNLTRRIARAAAPLDAGTVVEVGPGPGGLTRALLLEGAANVVAIELDRRAIDALHELEAAADGRLALLEADALQVDPASLGPAPRRIVANLPYNVSTPLLVRWPGHIAPGTQVKPIAVTPMPPPVQMEIRPRPLPFSFSIFARLATMRAPVAAKGCPSI